MKKQYNIILASSSPRRRELLQKYFINYEAIPTNVDEHIDKNSINTLDNCKKVIETLSYKKALSITDNLAHDTLVLGADTVVYIDGIIFGKPENKIEAKSFLKLLSGKKHQVTTSVTILNSDKDIVIQFSEVTVVEFIKYDEAIVDWYLKNNEYRDKAGAYAIQGLGAIFVEKISGDYDNVVGLPISKIILRLKDINIDILGTA